MATEAEIIPQSADKAGAIEILNWRPRVRKSLCGFVNVALRCGLVIHDIGVHRKGEGRWLTPPSREWTDSKGNRHFEALVEFCDRERADRFRDDLFEALDRYLVSNGAGQ